jgi:hypothetical protein
MANIGLISGSSWNGRIARGLVAIAAMWAPPSIVSDAAVILF